jgi:organic radical activating enzyme
MGRHYTATYEQIVREVDATFEIYDFIENVTVTGGEPLLHKQLFEICKYILEYRDKFTDLRIFTNGTLIPDMRIIELMKTDSKLKIVVDHYGDELSVHTWDIKELLEYNGLELRVNIYCGEEPYCGGWIDLGDISQYRNYTNTWLKKQVSECHSANWKNLLVFKGQLHRCSNSSFGSDLGFFVPKEDEFVDLFDNSLSLEIKREKASKLASQPMTSCQYCNGFNRETSARFHPAEQLKEL